MTDEEPARVPDTILRPKKNSNKKLSLHIPDPESPDEALCNRLTRCDETIKKDIECYPGGWRNWCEKCVSEQKRRLARADGGGQTHTTEIQLGDEVRAPGITQDETYIVRDVDDGYLIVERKRDGEVMPPVAKSDVHRA